MDAAIKITRDKDNFVTLTMDLPGKPVNTFSPQLFTELSAALDEFDRNKPQCGRHFHFGQSSQFQRRGRSV